MREIAGSGEWRAEDGEELVAAAERHGLTTLLEEALGSEARGVLGRRASIELFSLGALHRRRSRAQCAAFDEIVEGARREDLPICWLKGAAVAPLVYDRPSHRPMGDLDLLVAPGDVARATELLTGSGFTPRGGSWKRQRLSHQLPAARRGEGSDRVLVEVHVDAVSYLAPRPLARSMVLGDGVRVEELAAPSGEPAVATLGATDTLAQLVVHALNVRQRFTLIHLADIVRWVDRFGDRIDWRRLRVERPAVLHRLAWLAQLVSIPGVAAARRFCPDEGVSYRGWSRQGARPSRRESSLARWLLETMAPPEWWARAHYGATETAPTLWLRSARHPAHLARVAFHRLLER